MISWSFENFKYTDNDITNKQTNNHTHTHQIKWNEIKHICVTNIPLSTYSHIHSSVSSDRVSFSYSFSPVFFRL